MNNFQIHRRKIDGIKAWLIWWQKMSQNEKKKKKAEEILVSWKDKEGRNQTLPFTSNCDFVQTS